MGTYNIVEVLTEYQGKPTPAHKFCCLVSFNGQDPHYHEVESYGGEDQDAVLIDASLQKVADDAELLLLEKEDKSAGLREIQVSNGKIVI